MIIFIAVADPLYLTDFFDRVLSDLHLHQIAVFIVPGLYAKEGRVGALKRVLRTFGLLSTARLVVRVLKAKLHGQSIAAVCRAHGVPCEKTADVNAREFLERLRELDPDVIVSVSCPQIFGRELIDLPAKACLNIHGAILPHYRGVLPSFWILANGEREAGVSVHLVNEQLDSGDVCGQRKFAVARFESLDKFLRRSKAVAAELLVDVVHDLERGDLRTTAVDDSEGSYYSWPDRKAVQRFRAAGHRLW